MYEIVIKGAKDIVRESLAVFHERGDAYGQESLAIENLPADQRGELLTLLVGQADRDQ
jgi:hypothetical protein